MVVGDLRGQPANRDQRFTFAWRGRLLRSARLRGARSDSIEEMHLHWGDVPTWVGAIGALVGAFGTVGTLIWAVHGTLTDRRLSRMADEQSQATRVYAWRSPTAAGGSSGDHYSSRIHFGNTSDEPVYGVVVYLVWTQGSAYRTGKEAERHMDELEHGDRSRIRAVVQTIPPGRYCTDVRGPDNRPPQGQIGVELAFTDRAGQSWIRRATGELDRIDSDPIDHYGITRPIQYGSVGVDTGDGATEG